MATASICKVSACDKKHYAKGWCKKHYYILRDTPKCTITDCDGGTWARDLCLKHYRRFYRWGDPNERKSPNGELMKWIKDNVDFGGSECLIWPYNGNGYPKVRYGGRSMNACRAMCIEANGEPPKDGKKYHAAHSCGRGQYGCLNPRHLSWKTAAENAADKIIHGTHGRGERNARAKLTSGDVFEIRTMLGSGSILQREIAMKFNICQQTVSDIKRGRRWAAQ